MPRLISVALCRCRRLVSAAAIGQPGSSTGFLFTRPLHSAGPPIFVPRLHPASNTDQLSAASCKSGGGREEAPKRPDRSRFVAAGLLTWLGISTASRDEEPESELILTIKRGILAVRVSSVYHVSLPPGN
jgi:hypothetical protein